MGCAGFSPFYCNEGLGSFALYAIIFFEMKLKSQMVGPLALVHEAIFFLPFCVILKGTSAVQQYQS